MKSLVGSGHRQGVVTPAGKGAANKGDLAQALFLDLICKCNDLHEGWPLRLALNQQPPPLQHLQRLPSRVVVMATA